MPPERVMQGGQGEEGRGVRRGQVAGGQIGLLGGVETAQAHVDRAQLPAEATFPLPIPGKLALANGWELETRRYDAFQPEEIRANDDRWRAFLDESAAGKWCVRPRESGERFQPLGMSGQSKSVQDMMVDAKIPAAARALWPVVANEEHLLWVVGHQLDARARVGGRTQSVVEVRCVRPDNG